MSRILITDDDAGIRKLVRREIETASDLEVVAEAATGSEAVQEWRRTHPDVIVLDQQMPGMSGMEAAEIILAEQPDQAIIILTASANADALENAVGLGIRAVVEKTRLTSVPATIRAYSPP
jgi:two-component system nitrate/nitrite response regulator NarL